MGKDKVLVFLDTDVLEQRDIDILKLFKYKLLESRFALNSFYTTTFMLTNDTMDEFKIPVISAYKWAVENQNKIMCKTLLVHQSSDIDYFIEDSLRALTNSITNEVMGYSIGRRFEVLSIDESRLNKFSTGDKPITTAQLNNVEFVRQKVLSILRNRYNRKLHNFILDEKIYIIRENGLHCNTYDFKLLRNSLNDIVALDFSRLSRDFGAIGTTMLPLRILYNPSRIKAVTFGNKDNVMKEDLYNCNYAFRNKGSDIKVESYTSRFLYKLFYGTDNLEFIDLSSIRISELQYYSTDRNKKDTRHELIMFMEEDGKTCTIKFPKNLRKIRLRLEDLTSRLVRELKKEYKDTLEIEYI